MISDELKDQEYYYKLKNRLCRKYNWQWKNIAGPQYVGNCSYLFNTFYNEWCMNNKTFPTVDDFGRYYFSHHPDGDNNGLLAWSGNAVNMGRSVSQLTSLAKHYMNSTGNYNFTLEEYFDDIVCHVIIETYNGHIWEEIACRKYIDSGFEVERTNGYWDKDLGVDIIVRKDGVIKDYIQVKPISTFLETINGSLIDDRKKFYYKEECKKKECDRVGLPYKETKFLIYNTTHPGKWCSIGGRKSFKLSELCDTDGKALHKYSDFEYIY